MIKLISPYGGAILKKELELGIEGSIVLLRELRHRRLGETERRYAKVDGELNHQLAGWTIQGRRLCQ